MPIGGKLVLKGGATLGGVDKKKAKKKSKKGGDASTVEVLSGDAAAAATAAAAAAAAASAAGPSTAAEELPKDKLPAAYEKTFDLEAKRLQQGRERSTAWGATYRALPPGAVLHGHSAPLRGDTAEERLELRAAAKADRYCK